MVYFCVRDKNEATKKRLLLGIHLIFLNIRSAIAAVAFVLSQCIPESQLTESPMWMSVLWLVIIAVPIIWREMERDEAMGSAKKSARDRRLRYSSAILLRYMAYGRAPIVPCTVLIGNTAIWLPLRCCSVERRR